MHEAMRVVRAVRDVDVYIEQPCLSYEECLSIRRQTDHPFVLDEVIDGIDVLVRGKADLAMDVVNIKISKFGGLTKARQARDLCVSLGIAHDDRGQLGRRHHDGGDRPSGAQHAAGIPLHLHRFQQLRDGEHGRRCARIGPAGGMAASTRPGLGITPKMRSAGQARAGGRVESGPDSK